MNHVVTNGWVACLLVLQLSACARPGLERIVVVCIERLPAGQVGAYGATPSVTPTLDRLAAEGVRFEVAISPARGDRAAHASLLTALDPPAHGIRKDDDRIDPAQQTLLDAAKRRGLRRAVAQTRAAVSGDPLASGLEPGSLTATGKGALDAATAWLSADPRVSFIMVHAGDRAGSGPVTRSELAQIDAALGRFLAAFDATAGEGASLLVVTSARASGAGSTLRDVDLRVPLILRGMGLPEGRVVETPVRLVDIPETVASLARLPGLRGDGRTLFPLITGRPMPWPYAYAEAEGEAAPVALRSPRYKLVRGPATGSALYDLESDPGETRDVAVTHPAVVSRLGDLLDARVHRVAAAPPGAAPR